MGMNGAEIYRRMHGNSAGTESLSHAQQSSHGGGLLLGCSIGPARHVVGGVVYHWVG